MKRAVDGFRLFFDNELSQPTPYHAENDYFKKAQDRMDRTFDLIKTNIPGSCVVDVGASPFYLLYQAQAHGAKECHGLYFSNDTHPLRENAVIYSKYGPIRLNHANIETEKLPFADNSIDVLTACEILEHCEYFPSHFANEIHRVLRPGGIVCFTVPNVASIASIVRLIFQKNIYMKYRSDPTGRHKHEYTLGELKAFVQFLKLDITESGYFPSPTSSLFYLRPAYRALARIPLLRRYSPNLYIVARQPDPKPPADLGAFPKLLYDDSRSIEE